MSEKNETNYVDIIYDEVDLNYDPINWLVNFTPQVESPSTTKATSNEEKLFHNDSKKTDKRLKGSKVCHNFVNLEDLMNEAIIQSTAQDLSFKKF